MKNIPLIFVSILIWTPSLEAQMPLQDVQNETNRISPTSNYSGSLILPDEYVYLEQAPEFNRGPMQDNVPVFPMDSSITDTFPHPVKRKLLPDNTSWVERGLWGETGLFRKIGVASELTPETRKHELAVRRTMLTAHQIGGFVALGSMMTACYFGQKVIDGNAGYRSNHQLAVTASIISYSATGLLAVLSPPPLIRRDEVSTTTIHKELAWVHFAGMVLTPILGSMIGRRSYDQTARFHQVSAYITTAAMAASMITVTF